MTVDGGFAVYACDLWGVERPIFWSVGVAFVPIPVPGYKVSLWAGPVWGKRNQLGRERNISNTEKTPWLHFGDISTL